MNRFSKEDKISTLVSVVGPHYGETIVNKMEKLESAKGKEVTCDAIVEMLCKVWRATRSGKRIVGDSSGTELADPGYFAKDKTCHYCKEKGCLRND